MVLSVRTIIRSSIISSVSIISLTVANNASAQEQATQQNVVLEDIIVTAQRQAESLQDVPIAVSAFSSEALERQQIKNTTDLQLTLPNVTYTKTNFTTSNFAIRGIGDAAVGATADQGVGIHVNDMPVNSPRLFEIEFFDVDRIEILRGPQGTLFGRNATGGVFNLLTKRPTRDLGFEGEVEYGNYDSFKIKGAINAPLGDKLAVRVAGIYVNRDGYTRNLFDNSQIDGRNSYSVRGSVRFTPTDNTTIDLMASYFKEDSDRSRIQKQLCARDDTGILGCRPDQLAFQSVNGNSTLGALLASREFFQLNFRGTPLAPLAAGLALGSSYGPDIYNGVVNPADLRTVSVDFNPTYQADETIAMFNITHDFEKFSVKLTGGYQESSVNSRTDYNLTVANNYNLALPIALLTALSPNSAASIFRNGQIGVSQIDLSYSGLIGRNAERFAANDTNYDNSDNDNRQYSIEGHIDSQFDGPFNFLFGGIYFDYAARNDYLVAASGLDYASTVLGATTGLSRLGNPNFALASPFFNNETDRYSLKAWALFGEGYYEFNDKLKLTLGLRYTTDRKYVRDRSPLLSFLVPLGTTNASALIPTSTFDADPSLPGNQAFRETRVAFHALTGRAVLDWRPTLSFTDDTLVYLSYSRGYKGGGINPSFDPSIFTAPVTFRPERINAIELGTKNRFGGGKFQANLTAFYYDYSGLQISRILNRTSFNDNTDAEVYGVEGEFLYQPTDALLFNVTASYLQTRVKDLSLVDPRDPSGGRNDVVIIKDITNGSNCAVIPTAAGVPRADGLVGLVNSVALAGSGLQGTTPVPGTNTTGAYSVCSAIQATLAAVGVNPLAAISATNPRASTVYTVSEGVAVDLSGNELQNSPNFKFSIGGQYTYDFKNEWKAVFRVDYAYTGSYYGRNFNKPIDRINSYDTVNLQLTLSSPKDKYYLKGYVQNIENDNSITGLYVADPTSGLFTNVFTLEPRRYGITAGVKF